jgi:FAD/FMN-containing dehydrogenase
MNSFTRRSLLAGTGAVVGAAAVKAVPQGTASAGALLPAGGTGPGTVLNDASELNPVPVFKHIVVEQPPDSAFVDLIRKEIAEARSEGRAVCVGAARHSMGGQSLPLNGTAFTLDQQWLEADTASSAYRAAAGARWSTVISQLDRQGFSPAVMQSNNDFAVASTFCVNAHGWPVPFGPFGSTVRSFRMVMADGELVECSREQNRELFELSMGGYGLAGVIVDVVVDMVPNRMLAPRHERMPGKEFAARFVEAIKEGAGVSMAYGRLDVALDRFFDEALMITYSDAGDDGELPPVSGSGVISHISRSIYRAQNGSDRMKKLRWWMETDIGPATSGKATRNSLMNEPVVTLADRDPARTDILHEYFVPPERFAEFIDACREVIPSSYQEMLNITLRYVKADRESVLSFAPEHRIAGVMSFSQEKSVRAEEDMARMTRNLIDRVTAIGGAYYLPYRLHATASQMERAYPRLGEFVRRKLEADPDRVFRNAMWDRYMDNEEFA